MEWLNENSGILVLVSAVISIALPLFWGWGIFNLKKKKALQRGPLLRVFFFRF